MNNEFSLSNVKGKNSIDSTTSSLKSKRTSFRNQPQIINQIKNKNSNSLLKNNLSRNVKNLPICISQVTNLKNFHLLSTKLTLKENRNNSLNCQSKETLFAKEDSFKDNNKIYNFKSPESKNMSFNKYISRNRNCLVINDLLLNPSFDNFYKNITPKKNVIKSDKENSSLLKLSPIKLSSIKMPPIINSPRGNIKYRIKHLKKKYLNNINNNSTTIDKNISDINIISNKTKSPEDLNALSSFDLYGNNIINCTNNNIIEFKINNTIKNYSNLKGSFNKNKRMNKIIKNKNLFSIMNNSLLEEKNSEKKNFQNKLFSLAFNDSNFNQKIKLSKLIFESNDTKNKTAEKKKDKNKSNISRNERENKDGNKEENDTNSFFLSQERPNIFQTLKNNWERNNKKKNEMIQENKLDKTNNTLNKNNSNETKNNLNKNNEKLDNKVHNNIALNKGDNNNNLNKNYNNNEISIKAINNNNNNNKEHNIENKKNEVNNIIQKTKINKSCLNKNKNKKENKKIKLNVEKKISSQAISKDKTKISRKKTFQIKDYNYMKNKYSKVIIDSNKLFLEKNEFLNDLYKNIDTNNNKINKILLNTKVGLLHLNEAKIRSTIIKEYNNFKNKKSKKFNLNLKESQAFNIKILKYYKNELRNVFKKYKDAIYDHKYKCNNIGNSLNTTKYHFNYYINNKYNFDSLDSLKTKKDVNMKRRSITFSVQEMKKIQNFIKTSSVNSLPENNFVLLKTKPLYFNNEINWKNSNTNFLWIHNFILKEHYLDLNEDSQCYYKVKEGDETSDKPLKRPKLRKIVSDNNIPGFRTLIRQNSIIRFSPSMKMRCFSRSPSFIDLSSIRKNSMELEKKKDKPKNINDFSLLSIKNFYNFKKSRKLGKYLQSDNLLNIEEIDDDDNNDELSEDNKKIPFILQLKESDYNIVNKGEFLLENSRTIEDIYIGLNFLIVEGKEKFFINKVKELKNDIDINNQILEGNTFLIISTREGNKNITKFLCEEGCEINIQNFKGNTALHYAIANLFFDIVDILISFRAKEDIINLNGLRPWDCIGNNLE